MTRFLLFTFIFVLYGNCAEAVDRNRYFTEPDTIFCMNRSAINNLKAFLAQGDKRATAKLFEREDCAIVKPSINVFIVQDKGDVVKVRREGMPGALWTFRRFLR